jgi:carotenoid cleavage dioxygenase-like enzyme
MSEHKSENRRSILNSIDTPIETNISGNIPYWLSGTLFRNGPGRYDFDSKIYQHLFDGQACIHKFKIENGNVFYSNKLLETESYKKTISENRLFPNFGTTKAKENAIKRLITFYKQPSTTDNVNINIVPFANEQLYALTETNRFCQIDPFSLDIIKTLDIKNYVSSTRTTIAHPHIDSDGSWITVGINPVSIRPKYDFLRYKITDNSTNPGMVCCDQIELIASLPSSYLLGMSYFHSFGITENYIVFLEQPLILSYRHLFLAIIKNRPLSDCFVMKSNLKTRIHLIEKKSGKILEQKYLTKSQFSFHFLNSYETIIGNEGFIIIDISSYDSEGFDLKDFTHENIYSGSLNHSSKLKSIPRRIKVPIILEPKNKDIFCEIIDLNTEFPFELPTINYNKKNGLPYKYAYGTNYYRKPFSIIKLNLENPTEVLEKKYLENGCLCIPSEPIFVERPDATSEDDGALLVLVLSDHTNDFLSILDAKNLNEIARAVMPSNIRGINEILLF